MHWNFRRKKQPQAEKSPGKELLDDSKRIMSSFILTIISALVTIPLFIILYRYVPDIIIPAAKGIRIDHILTIIVLFTVIRVAAYFIRFFLYGASAMVVVLMIVGQIVGGFGFTDVYKKYMDLITYVGSNPIKISFLGSAKSGIPDSERILRAINYEDPVVRDFAVSSSRRYFADKEYNLRLRHVVKYFSIFKVMSAWDYVHDPKWEEYLSSASESIPLMAGDCDDYAILMAACIKAIGGEVRLVRTMDHLYPEVKVCTYEDFPEIIDLIKNRLFFKESLGNRIYYHLDEWNNIWLNFDYTNIYPGSEFMSNDIIGILEI
jgi:ABC-type multidrug transport system fused ATPase/permease subunit